MSRRILVMGYCFLGATVLLSTHANAQPEVLWHNATTGELSVWLQRGGTVTGTSSLSWRCGAADGCSSAWRVVGTGDINGDFASDVFWHNAATGEVSVWLQRGGTVLGNPALSWRCGAADGCSTNWKAVGIGDFNNDGRPDVLWHNALTGELSAWLLNGSTVTGAQSLSWRCGAADGCSNAWKVVGLGDFNNDGRTDVLWHNLVTGELSAWLLNGSTVTGTQSLSWNCDLASGCSTSWRVVGISDFNYDGRPDVLWHNPTTGELSAWLLNGSTVTGTQSLSWRCGAGDGCSTAWKAVAIF